MMVLYPLSIHFVYRQYQVMKIALFRKTPVPREPLNSLLPLMNQLLRPDSRFGHPIMRERLALSLLTRVGR